MAKYKKKLNHNPQTGQIKVLPNGCIFDDINFPLNIMSEHQLLNKFDDLVVLGNADGKSQELIRKEVWDLFDKVKAIHIGCGDQFPPFNLSENRESLANFTKQIIEKYGSRPENVKVTSDGSSEAESNVKKRILRKKKWNKNKSEFARFIKEESEKHPEKYRSLRDASNKLYEEYEFDYQNWTKENCYALVRQQ